MQTYLIIADDFTGANDTGLQLVRRSVKVRVQIGRPGLLPPSYSLVLDTESRNLSPQQAVEAVQASLLDMDMASFSVVMKKIDSTLRGNIVEEVSEVAKRMQACIIVVATAFPDMGRICKDSVVYVHEKPLRETEHGKDPHKPVTEDNLSNLFSSFNRVVHLSVDTIRARSWPMLRDGVVVCDSTTNEDLNLIAEWALSLNRKVLFVGSAGLGEALVNQHYPSKPILGLVASLSEVTRRQVLYAQNRGISTVSVSVCDLLVQKGILSYAERVRLLLSQNKDVLLIASSVLEPSEYKASIETGRGLGLSESQVGNAVRLALSTIAKEVMETHELGGLFLTGGDTAF
ncbi:MAG: four-carbon acid sugar kinase family protein, partial [Spirochaetia bacterium]|nr:four-carbon acid sugar kinase family protein [Spirochaetia bacterium]